MTTTNQSLDHSLVSNGLDFISSGINSINSGNPEKIKYAILHLFSGALLVLKERVHQEHWSLLFQKVEQANWTKFSSGDFESINYDRLIHVLKEICKVELEADGLKALDDLRKIRNKVEHFKFEVSILSIKPISAKVLSFLISFIETNLTEQLVDEREIELFSEIKSDARQFHEYVQTRVGDVNRAAQKNGKDIFNCPECFEKAMVREESDFVCYVCDQNGADVEDVVSAHLEHGLGLSYYETVKHGGEWPLYDCPECDGHQVLAPLNNSGKIFLCINCGFKTPSDKLHSCSRCGTMYHAEEGNTYCQNCWDNVNADD